MPRTTKKALIITPRLDYITWLVTLPPGTELGSFTQLMRSEVSATVRKLSADQYLVVFPQNDEKRIRAIIDQFAERAGVDIQCD